MRIEYELNIRQACYCVSLQRCVYCYCKTISEQKAKDDIIIADKIRELAHKHNKWGFTLIRKQLKRKGEKANHKRIYRIYKELGLSLRRKKCKQRIPNRIKEQIIVPRVANEVWSMDYILPHSLCS